MSRSKFIYDKIAKYYDKGFGFLDRKFLSKWRGEVLSYLPDNSKILEVGAGTGLNFRFYPSNCSGVASEISFGMLEIAGRKAGINKIKLVQADAEKLPFANDYFDCAFATLVFCSISKPEDAFRELQRVVGKGGKIVLLEHVRPKGLLGFGFEFLNIFTVALIEDHFNRRTAEIAEKSGLKVVDIRQKAFGIINLIICEVTK